MIVLRRAGAALVDPDRRWWTFGAGIAVAVAVWSLWHLEPEAIRWLEYRTVDFRFRARKSAPPSGAVAAVVIGDESLKDTPWPWPRDKYAPLVENLVNDGARAVVFDMVFAEQKATDRRLAEAIRAAGNVVLGCCRARHSDGILPKSSRLPSRCVVELAGSSPPSAKAVLALSSELAMAGPGVGFIDAPPDADGTLRRLPLLIRHEKGFYLHAALQAALLHRGIDPHTILVAMGEHVAFDTATIPVDATGEMLINYIPPVLWRDVTHTAEQVRSRSFAPGTFAGKTVVLGVAATGIADRARTPFGTEAPGVLVTANAIGNILSGRYLRQMERRTEGWAMATLGLLACLGAWLLRPIPGVLAIVLLLVGWVAASQWAFATGLVLPVVYPLAAVAGGGNRPSGPPPSGCLSCSGTRASRLMRPTGTTGASAIRGAGARTSATPSSPSSPWKRRECPRQTGAGRRPSGSSRDARTTRQTTCARLMATAGSSTTRTPARPVAPRPMAA